ncbi:branched-chain amino acid ABC transporter substrate-binding protein [Nakamurella lactea]|uniref:branched-chain amino acid ABC transporter substrate-binding protein n=1 Tax=Nakamurella lactea TaxID=459515 RepID=UPI000A02FD09|nr:branched-chain amino acid ABC transporter substrate-binding protein [Nakamurella lactea]
MRGALVVVAVATLALAACGSKNNTDTTAGGGSGTTAAGSETSGAGGESSAPGTESSATSGTGDAGGLKIVPQLQIDKTGKEVPAAAAADAADPAGDGKAKCSGISLAMAGALTGPNAALGINILNGAKVALDKHNKANADCQVEMKPFDTEGDPQKATQVAPQIVNEKSVIGLLGPAFSGETKATGGTFNQAGLLALTASATNPDLAKNGWKTFFRGLANDATQGPAVAKYMAETLKYKKVCVVQDNSDYGVGLAKEITTGLGSVADSSCAAKVKTGDKDFSATVSLITGASPDAVFYSGYYAEAAPFVAQLRDGGFTGTFVSADGTNDPQFVAQAGAASKDAILSCPCGPAPEAFAKEYQTLNNAEPGVYSVEGYDLTTIMLKAIDSGVKDRAGMIDFVKNYSGQGLAREYKWDATGELAAALIWIYKVQ